MQGGVVLSVGTQVMGPEVFLKALAMSRNVAGQHGESINRFTTAVFDLTEPGPNIHQEAPARSGRLLLPALQDPAGAHGSRRRRELLRAGMYRQTLPTLYLKSSNRRAEMDLADLRRLLGRFPELTVLVVGDFFLDKYLDIEPKLSERSLETGLEAYQVAGVRRYPARPARWPTTCARWA